ncbi:MAG: YCF48-related protein [Melioribacteraceae bacterium]|nr:YCF48-related protein [Melioribacteraceae bacterium]
MINRYSDLSVTDNGIDWEIASSAGLWNAGDIYFIDESVGFAAKENAGIYKTIDGGESWTSVLDPLDFASTNKVGGITFADDQTGYAWFSISGYGDYRVYKTTNQGDDWVEVAQIEGPGYLSGGIEFFDADNGFIAGPRVKPDSVYFSWAVYTEDGGTTWNDADFSAVPDEYKGESIDGVAKVDDNTAFAIGDVSFLKTDDMGKTWSYVDFGQTLTDTNFYRIAFNGDYGIVTTYDGEILTTEDGGETWELNQEYYDLHSPSALAVTDDGRIYLELLVGMYLLIMIQLV